MKRFEIFFGIIKIPLDFAMTVLAFLAAYQLRLLTEPIEGFTKPIDYSVLPTIKEYFGFSLIMAAVLVVIFIFGNMYNLKSTFRFSREARKTFTLCLIWAMFIITYFFFTRTFPFSRLAIIYSWLLTFLFILMGRAIIRTIQKQFLKAGIGKRNLAFLGSNSLTTVLSQEIKKDLSYKLLGIIGNKTNSPLKYLGKISELQKLIKKYKIHEIILTRPDLSENQNEELLRLCDLNHVTYRFAPDLVEMRRSNIEVETLSGIPIISLKHTPLDGWGKVVKRIMDIVLSSLGLIVLSPVFLITAIAIKLDSKGPVFFTRKDDGSPVMRVGQYGNLIQFYKFRSMRDKTDSQRYKKLARSNMRKEGPLIKIQNDPRITGVGRFIRKFSIDELPQLYSVLKGDLSLVGPRPHLPEEVEKYKEHQKFVLTIKPGVSGISQVSGRSDLSFDEEVKLDHFYIENWSIWLDIKIILKTFVVVFRGYKE